MIKSVTVTNHLDESLKLELRFPEKSGFLIQNMEGLGPSKANINITEMSTSDGSIYNSSRVNSRNIILTLKLLATPTVEETRQKSYKYFPIKKRIKLTIETDIRTCDIYGYVEANEPNIFSSSVSTQISIICPDPYFYSSGNDGKQTTTFSAIEPLFEFPFSNESINDEIMQFAQIINNHEQTVYYTGDSEVGVVIFIHSFGDVTNLTINNSGSHETMKINTDKLALLTGYPIKYGDDIIISTIKGNKYIKLFRDGIYTNIINCLDKDADWFQLIKGDNVFAYTADTGVTKLQFRIENKIIYEGV